MPAFTRARRRILLQLARLGALSAALTGLGWIIATEGFAAEPIEPVLTIDIVDDDEDLDRRPRFAVAMSIPEALAPMPDPEIDLGPPPAAKSVKARKKKMKFGRMDAY